MERFSGKSQFRNQGAKPTSMRILPAKTAIFVWCFLFLGTGLFLISWTAANAQEAPETAGAPGPGAAPAPEAGSEEEHVISPEQQELLADMLGRGVMLAGCQMGNGEVDRKVVNVVYACPSGEVAVQLVHPSQAPSDATETDHFAITLQSGTPPEELLPALASRIRSKEAGFEWTLVGGADPSSGLFSRSDDDTRRSGSMSVSWVRLGVAGLLGIGVMWWILRRLAARKKAS
jgi:hypothetical protein